MSPALPTVTFVGHDASRTGAPTLLATLLDRLAGQGVPGLHLILLDGGPLLERYRSVVPTQVLGGRASRAANLADAAVRSVGRRPTLVAPLVRRVGLRGASAADVVVANTLASLATAREVAGRSARFGSRLVCIVHELDGVAGRVLPDDERDRRELLATVDQFVAVSEPVRRMLVGRLGVAGGRVAVLHPFVELHRPAQASIAAASRSMRGGMDRPVVASVGAMSRRKGPERFVDLMSALAAHPSSPVGVWLGGDPSDTVWGETETDVAGSADPTAIRLLPTVADATPYLAASDVVVSTAVEDPFPLVLLEAGASGVPVAGFDSGGITELLEGCAQRDAVVEVGDTLALAAVVAGLLDDPRARRAKGRRLEEWVRSNHSAAVLVPLLWDAIVG